VKRESERIYIKYRSVYLKLDKKRRKQITTLDYADSLHSNPEALKKVSMKVDLELNQAFKIVEKVDRLRMIPRNVFEIQKSFSSISQEYYSKKNLKPTFVSSKEAHKLKEILSWNSTDIEVDKLISKMKQLSIRVSYYL